MNLKKDVVMSNRFLWYMLCVFIPQITYLMNDDKNNRIIFQNEENSLEDHDKIDIIKDYFRYAKNPTFNDFSEQTFQIKESDWKIKYNQIEEYYKNNMIDYVRCASHAVFVKENQFFQGNINFIVVDQDRRAEHICIKRDIDDCFQIEYCASPSIEQRMQNKGIVKIIVTANMIQYNPTFINEYIRKALDNDYILEDNKHNSFLHLVTKYDNIDGCDLIGHVIKKSLFAINSKNKLGETPLVYAVTKENLQLCRLFLQNGADPNTYDQNHMTVFHRACSLYKQKKDKNFPVEELLKIIDLLLEYKADPHIKNVDGVTPIMYAAFQEDVALYARLRKYNAKLDIEIDNYSDEKLSDIISICVKFSDNKIPSIKTLRSMYQHAKVFAEYGAIKTRMMESLKSFLGQNFSLYSSNLQKLVLREYLYDLNKTVPSLQNQ